jgi:hypothetical protein
MVPFEQSEGAKEVALLSQSLGLGSWMRIPDDLQWITSQKRVDSWPVTGLPTDTASRTAARKLTRSGGKPRASAQGQHAHYGPANNSSSAFGKAKNSGPKSSKRQGKKGTLCTDPSDKQTLFTLLNANTNINEHTILISVLTKQENESDIVQLNFRCLIDTGAVQENYISYEVYDQLISLGFVNKSVNIEVCAAYNDCQTTTESLTLNIHFNYNPVLINNANFELVLNFTVLKNIKYDFIIGRPDIILHDVWNRTLLSNRIQNGSGTEVTDEYLPNTSTARAAPSSPRQHTVEDEHVLHLISTEENTVDSDMGSFISQTFQNRQLGGGMGEGITRTIPPHMASPALDKHMIVEVIDVS